MEELKGCVLLRETLQFGEAPLYFPTGTDSYVSQSKAGDEVSCLSSLILLPP